MSRFARAAPLVALAALGCAELRPAGLYLEQASYELVVDGTDVVVTPSGGVRLQSDLGYEIEIERAFLLQSSASLVDCEGVGGDVWDDFVAGLRMLAAPGRAYAGHGEALDPSAVVTPTYVDLLAAPGALHRTSLGAQVFASTRYCRAHQLVAMTYEPELVRDAPEGVDLSGVSFALEGAWRSPEQPDWHPLSLHSTLSFGALVNLPEVYEGELHDAYAQVRIRRRLASLMDGIELAASSDDEVARALLRNLVTHAEVRVVVTALPDGDR